MNPRVIARHDFKATIQHDGPGPLVELIVLGRKPPTPFTLGLVESTREVDRQLVYASTSYLHGGRTTDVTVEASWQSMVGARKLEDAITLVRLDLSKPEVVVRSASISVAEYGKLEGVIKLEARNAPFSYDATIELGDYNPKLRVRCPR